MKKIIILGNCGAGKSTLARELGRILGITRICHLDAHYWNEGWVITEESAWQEKLAGMLNELDKEDAWIMDGNYSKSLHLRLPYCDTIIYLDFPTWLCLYRIVKRVLRDYGRVRLDMAEGCPEKFDLEFIEYVATYRNKRKPEVMEKLAAYKDKVRFVTLRNPQEVAEFVRSFGVATSDK
jgi:adenylate kinase family enzyme